MPPPAFTPPAPLVLSSRLSRPLKSSQHPPKVPIHPTSFQMCQSPLPPNPPSTPSDSTPPDLTPPDLTPPDSTPPDSNSTLTWLLSALGTTTQASSSKLLSVIQRGTFAATDLSQQALISALRTLGVEPFDTSASSDLNDPLYLPLPRFPFDPVLALVLAGYAFRAYLQPSRSAYYENFEALVKGSAVSKMEKQSVYTEFMYLDSGLISKRAEGIFMLHVREVEGLKEGWFAVAKVNSALVFDVFTKRNFSVLRVKDSYGRNSVAMERDNLVFSIFANRKDHDEGEPPICAASVSLADLVKQGLESGENVDGEETEMLFAVVTEAEKKQDFFQFSLLPNEINLPFQNIQTPQQERHEQIGSEPLSVLIQVTFVPFPKELEDENISSSCDEKDTLTSLVFDEQLMASQNIMSALTKELQPGQMPCPKDWSNLASVARSVTKVIGEEVGFERTATVTEKLPGSLFIESLSTDTEVWLFHDRTQKNIIVSFRGTEQVSWKDFVTDAQVFLQRWTPGEEIDLDVDIAHTVGLSDFVPSIFPDVGSMLPENAPAVHYGFLRAYLSVRDALLRGINLLSSDLTDGYSLHFTGHSLGGALATLAAADFQALHQDDNFEVCCMSFGAPRVGNIYFAQMYNRLVPNSFRIVNDADLVSRMPRSLPSGSPLGRYKHTGRTVLINDAGSFWIEGHTQEAFNRMAPSNDPFREKHENVMDLIAFEQKLWSELMSGRSVQHHMEDSYYMAMQRVLKMSVNNRLA